MPTVEGTFPKVGNDPIYYSEINTFARNNWYPLYNVTNAGSIATSGIAIVTHSAQILGVPNGSIGLAYVEAVVTGPAGDTSWVFFYLGSNVINRKAASAVGGGIDYTPFDTGTFVGGVLVGVGSNDTLKVGIQVNNNSEVNISKFRIWGGPFGATASGVAV